MKRAIATLTFAAAIFTSTMAHGQDDHGDTRATATSVAVPSDTAGRIDPVTEDDYFSFTLSAQTALAIGTTGPSVDTRGWLYDSSGTQLEFNDDSGYVDHFLITRTLAAGTYYVRVAFYQVSGVTPGNYSLRLIITDSDTHGGSRATATSVAVPSDTAGTIYPSTESDYFSFTLAGTVITAIETTGRTDTQGWLYNSSGTELATNDDGGTDTNFRIRQSLTAGTYYVRVGTFGSNIGPYTLLVRAPQITVSATGNCAGTPANCGTGGDRDTSWPGLQVDEGDTVSFSLTITPAVASGLMVVNSTLSGTAQTSADLRQTDGTTFPSSAGVITGTIAAAISSATGTSTTVATALIYSDSATEVDETLVFSGGTIAADTTGQSYTIGTPSSVTVTIRGTDSAPTFGAGSVSAKTYTANAQITEFQVPPATGGNGTINYAASGLPAGLRFDATGSDSMGCPGTEPREICGTPNTATSGAVTVTITATDSDSNTMAADGATLTFSVTVNADSSADTAPSFGGGSVSAKTYTTGTAITEFQVPPATGGNGTINYAASGLPAGLRFDATGSDSMGCPGTEPREICGTPNTATSGAVTVTITATDSDSNNMASDRATLTFSVTVNAQDTAPSFGSGSVAAKTYIVNAAITEFQVPPATGGNGTINYAASGLPAGLRFDATGSDSMGCPGTEPREICGTPNTATSGAVTVTITATDSDSNNMASDRATLTFSVTVNAGTAPDTAPSFGGGSVSAKTYTTTTAINEFQIPAATGGNGTINYMASGLPAGLRFDATGSDSMGCPGTEPREICGKPFAATSGAQTVTITATDSDSNNMASDRATLTFSITVNAADDSVDPVDPVDPPPPTNLAPETTGTIDAVSLEPGQSVAYNGRDYFNDPDGYTLNFSGSSSNPAVATVEASDYDTLTVAGVAEGLAEVTLSAADSGGLSASLSFMVTVGNPATLGGAGELSAFASAPEGGVVELTVSFAKPRDADVELAWAIGIDNDPATADADENDHGGAAGEVVIPAGETSATINIAIADDADIEPAREVFVVSLTPQEGLGFGVANATVHVEEGVCDRTPQLADELRGDRDCAAVTSAELKRRVWVRLEDAGLAELHPRDLLGMAGLTALFLDGNGFSQLPDGLLSGSPALRLLRLRGNRFDALPALQGLPELLQLDMGGNFLRELPSAPFAGSPNFGYLHLDGNSIDELPADLIAGLGNLRLLELQDNSVGALPDGFFDGVGRLVGLKLQDNAGAPFTVSVELAVVDAEDGEDAETAASIRLSVPQGAPFDMAVPLTVAGGTIAAETATIAAGQTMGTPIDVLQGEDAGAVTVSIGGAPAFPPARCGDSDSDPCFTGIQLELGGPVTLFVEPAAIIVPTLRR